VAPAEVLVPVFSDQPRGPCLSYLPEGLAGAHLLWAPKVWSVRVSVLLSPSPTPRRVVHVPLRVRTELAATGCSSSVP